MEERSASRNAPCHCGSGLKHKRCCLAETERAARAARTDDAVSRHLQAWSADVLGDEISAALEEFVGDDRFMGDEDIAVFTTWFHNDRELSGAAASERELGAALMGERMLRWLDEPHQLLGGQTPREAVTGHGRDTVVRLLRQIENSADRARRNGEPAPDVSPLREHLGLRDDLAA